MADVDWDTSISMFCRFPSSAFIPRLSPQTWYMSPHCPLARCETYRWVKLRNSRPRPSRPPNRPSRRWHLLLVTRAANEPSPKFWPRSSRGHGLRHICHAAVTLVPWQQVSLVASDPVMWRCVGVMSCVTSRRLTHCTAHTPAWPGLHIVHMPGTTWPRIHQGCRKPVEMWDDWLNIYYLLSWVRQEQLISMSHPLAAAAHVARVGGQISYLISTGRWVTNIPIQSHKNWQVARGH